MVLMVFAILCACHGSILGVQQTCWCGAGENESSPVYSGIVQAHAFPYPVAVLAVPVSCCPAHPFFGKSNGDILSGVTPFDRVVISFFFFFDWLLVSYARQCHGEPGSNAKGDIVYP
ncbi:hypothetical protein EDB85DRAFT_840707 [Lactarius pseudohatsudake]|nr:hypothetical protein EDB85DRAFT_840707 [Lactarius pseudohatsudake]